MLQELTFVDRVLLITVFDLAVVRGKFSYKNIPKFIARPGWQCTSPAQQGPGEELFAQGVWCGGHGNTGRAAQLDSGSVGRVSRQYGVVAAGGLDRPAGTRSMQIPNRETQRPPFWDGHA